MEDAYEALHWVLNNATSFNGDANRVAVAGESAGGNLATVCCIELKSKAVDYLLLNYLFILL